MNKWRVDLSGGSGRSVTRTHDSSLNPPGFTPGFTQGSQHVERSQQDQQQQHLMSSKTLSDKFKLIYFKSELGTWRFNLSSRCQ